VEIQLSSERVIPPADVLRLYSVAAWWPARTESEVEKVVVGGRAAGAWDGERLIGFARFVTDGRFRAYIEDVIVDPAHRNKGVATALVQRLLDALSEIDVVSLFCDETSAGVYERSGFSRTRQVVMHYKARRR